MDNSTRIRADVILDMEIPYTREEISKMGNPEIQEIIVQMLAKMPVSEIRQSIRMDGCE